jgi:phosphatidylinositol-3-phosphatase
MSSVRRRRNAVALLLVAALGPVTACSSTPAAPATPTDTSTSPASGPTTTPPTSPTSPTPPSSPPAGTVPRPDHVVVVVLENEDAGAVIGSPDAPYINTLAAGGAVMTQSHAVRHPSQPNYIALFSGSTHRVRDDACTHTFGGDNQASEMLAAGFTFMSYAEDLPSAGSTVCSSGQYFRKHAPWTDFTNVPPEVQQPFSAFPSDYSSLPDVSWVIPNVCNDMHSCSVATGDAWLRNNLGGYAQWALEHNSLLVLTFDEDDKDGGDNQIPTIFYGAQVAPGSYDEHITHYNVLRTMEDMYGVPHLGKARKAKPITDIWR